MDLSFYPLTLEAVDQADAESLCLFVGEDERPLTGLAGLADWRLAGGLSRLLRKGLVKGVAGEALLTPGSRLGFRKLFLFGLGPAGQSEEELAGRVADGLRRLQAAGVENAALQLPSKLPLDLGIRTLIDEEKAPARAQVFGPDPAALVRALSHAASRGSSETSDGRRVIKVPGPPRPQPTGRVGPPPKAPPTEVPKASPLPFAPANARLSSSPGAASTVEPKPEVRAEPAAVASPPPVAAQAEVPTAPLAAPSVPPAGRQAEADVPVAPAIPDSIPPAAAAPAPAATLEGPAPVTQPAGTPASPSDAPVAPSITVRPDDGKKPLPIDHKPARFKPPEPRVHDNGNGKGRKKRR